MLREIADAKQIPGEPKRRWFSDESFDLIVWEDPAEGIAGFQLCYDKGTDQRALTWFPDSGLRDCAVDNGESRPGKPKAVPILICESDADGRFVRAARSPRAVLDRFRRAGRDLDPEIVRFVSRRIDAGAADADA